MGRKCRRLAQSSIGMRCRGWKGSKNQDSSPLQLFYYMSESERVFHLNLEFLMNGQTSCKPSRPAALISPTVHFLDGLPYFKRLCLASLLWGCQRGVEGPLWDSQTPPCNVCPEAGPPPASKCVWSFVKQGEGRGERALKERKISPLLEHVCELTELELGWQKKKGLQILISCHLFCDMKCLNFRHFDHT